ncbi:MAG: hypothetical protein JRI61_11590 [Deltaproteobacteria bacterium]|nr:hypothetical protein [Deltaproteobacteria bacterium]
MMKKEDLTRLKHVGTARMKLLNDYGIMTIEQLHKMPLEKLAEIKSFNLFYAKRIKDSVSEYYREKQGQLNDKSESMKATKTENNHLNLRKKIKKLRRRLSCVNEKFKPLWGKKYLKLYVDFKKKSGKLKVRLTATTQIEESLSTKDKKKIIKKLDALNSNLKKIGKKPKKKKYQQATQKIQSFSRLLRDMNS